MKQVWVCFWTFDILHPGHIDFLKQAKNKCDILICVISRDKNVEKIKWKLPINNENIRLKNIKSLNIADKVILWSTNNFFDPIKKLNPNLIFLWYDQKTPKWFENFVKQNNIKVIKLKPFKASFYKSSKLKNIFNKKLV